jgi:hypothetical protein
LKAGNQAVQSIHSLHEFQNQHNSLYQQWLKTPTIVLLSVRTIQDLQFLKEKLNHNNVPNSPFFEPDLDYALTAICIAGSEDAKKLCKNLPLGLSEFKKGGCDE